jgi:hypothetical protein
VPEQHHQFIPMLTSEEPRAMPSAWKPTASGATSAGIFREHTEPNSMCIVILENDFNEFRQQRLAVAAGWLTAYHIID